MANVLANAAKMTVSGTPGTGTITLLAAAPNAQTFASAGIATGATVSYRIDDGTNWEVGIGVYTLSGLTLTRGTIVASSNSGSAISATSAALVAIAPQVTDMARPLNRQLFTSSGTWTKPAGFNASAMAFIRCWGAGASGGKNGGAGGGGGGYNERWVLLSSMGATETATVGSGGASVSASGNGNNGGNTSLGSWLTAYGGIAGGGGLGNAPGGGGGGQLGAGSGTTPGKPLLASNLWTTIDGVTSDLNGAGIVYSGAGGGTTWNAQDGYFHGGGGAGVNALGVGGSSLFGGAGGGQYNGSTAGGTSMYGGNGGAGSASSNGVAGTAPGGGGGGTNTGTNSGAGAAGQIEVLVFDGY